MLEFWTIYNFNFMTDEDDKESLLIEDLAITRNYLFNLFQLFRVQHQR